MGTSEHSTVSQHTHTHRRSWGGAGGALAPPLEKLISLAGQKRELGRTEMGAWQDRNGSLAGQKWEAWQKIIRSTHHLKIYLSFLSVFCHFWLVSAMFSCFSSIFDCFAAIHLPSLPIGRTVWQRS